MDAIKLEEVSEVEVGAEGVRVTLRNGDRTFVGGEVGFELCRRWTEWKQESRKFHLIKEAAE
jgi:hypothetical protein